MIKDLRDGDTAKGMYLVKNSVKGLTSAGLNYLNITLQDKTGVIEGKKWDIGANDIEVFKIGNVVQIEGDVNLYREKLQVKIYNGFEVDQKTADLTNLLLESPIPVEELIKKYQFYMNSVKNNDCKRILDAVFKKYYESFITYPAAVTNHHEFYHGLIYHTVFMCDLANSISKLYSNIDYDLLISGCLLHDIGKVVEFSGSVATKYTVEGNLLGHISIGMSIVKEVSDELKIEGEVPMLLEHMILSHHGKQEFGSPVLPTTREALLLSMIDDMDSKMMTLDKAYDGVAEGEFTERIYAFENRNFYKPHKN